MDLTKRQNLKDDVDNFIGELSQTQGWSNTPILSLNKHQWNEKFELNNGNARFFRITELSAEEEATLRQDLENVIACLDDPDYCWVYYISGTSQGIELYLGVVNKTQKLGVVEHSKLLTSQLEGNLTGIQLDPVRDDDLLPKIVHPLQESVHFGLLHGVPSRSIDQQLQTGQNITQGIDRLARGLSGEVWQLLLIAEPAQEFEINQQIDELLQLSSDLHPHIKRSQQLGKNDSTTISNTTGRSTSYGLTKNTGTSVSETKGTGNSETFTHQKGTNSGGGSSKGESGSSWNKGTSTSWGDNKSESKASGTSTNESQTLGKNTGKSISKTDSDNTSNTTGTNTGSSTSDTLEYINKKIERVQSYINDKLIERFDLGRSKGMFRTAVYLAAPTPVVYNRLSHAMVSIFQGNQSHFSPLRVTNFSLHKKEVHNLFLVQSLSQPNMSKQLALIHSIPQEKQAFSAATWLNANELSLLAGLPSREVRGIKLRKNVDFAVNPVNPEQGFELGDVVQHGRKLKDNAVRLDKKLLNQHIFISGTTGAGKTTTCQQILIQSGLPFLVIEPAKTEYRSLSKNHADIEYYTLGNEKVSPFRFNPFELLPNEPLSGHIDMLKATFAAVFPMEASMPYLIEEAIVRSYEQKGWDIHYDENYLYPDPWNCGGQSFPIFSEVLLALKKVIESKGFGRDLQEKYEGSLISRLDNLTTGAKGRMLNTRNSIDINELLDKKVVIELEDLRDEQDKCLMMGLLIGRVAEAVKQRHKLDHDFQHLTLLEEAHRLLSKPQSGEDSSKRLGVELFANLLAEVRKYGEGLIIADQIPNKLTPEVLKNTNTKIIHRLFAADDRHAIGDTVGLNDEQKEFLTLLNAGEAIVYSAGWHEAVRVQVHTLNDTNAPEIDVEVIKQLGQQRMFAQRAKLYPNLSVEEDWQAMGVKIFNQYLVDATKFLNLMIRWVISPSTEWVKRIQYSFAELKQKYIFINQQQTLNALFKDIAPTSSSEKYTGDLTIFQLHGIILTLIEKNLLPDNPHDHESQVFSISGGSGRNIWNDISKSFKQIQSI
ncbi:helicase HerA domain-containing protein [Acinetobacter radioresistens]|uniref:ATP-binding protein n=1 Tax=Acinetobacter radioresistens TaxID=40216 RepID=UPI003B2806F5